MTRGRVRGIKKPRPQVAGLINGVGRIWLWMGGEEIDLRFKISD